ncbi:MAG: NADH-quinone oxidoreductase subunit NuoK [Deltaproteobacteria bacterium]|nr:NADH-quinone oxidoreductase subunit NuoK [Deltaproteobacteria bacterium]
MTPSLVHFLIVGALLFACGILCVITRRNAVGVLMGVELILNSANINFLAFAHFSSQSLQGGIDGHVFALFCIVLAALECAVALAIVMAIYRNFNKTIDMEELTTLRE